MRYYEAPDNYEMYTYGETTIFLAGGITDCPDWQADMVNLLSDAVDPQTGLELVLFNPRQANFNVRDVNAASVQIKWEYDHLRRSDRILFWFPNSPPSICPITLFELGYWLNSTKRLAVGVEHGYVREADVRIQTGLARPDVPVVHSLEALATAIK